MNAPSLTFVIGSLSVGGAETHLATILPPLARKGWAIEVISLSRSVELAPHLEDAGIPVRIPPRWSACNGLPKALRRGVRLGVSFFRLWWFCLKNPGRLLHFFLPEAYLLGTIAAFCARHKGLKLMSRRCLNVYHQRRPILANLEPWAHHRMDVILGNSQAVIGQLKNEENVSDSKLKLIYNGLETQRFDAPLPRKKTRKSLKVAEDALVFIIVANLIPYKGHADLLEAFSKISKMLPTSWRLLCVGRDDGILPALQQKAQELKISDNVLWLGSRSDVPDLYHASDIGILCSHEEGFSNAILEGMASGLPMVVTRVGGNGEAVLEGKTGFTVPSRDPAALAAALQTLAQEPALSKKMGAEGKKRLQKLFTVETCVDAYHSLYKSLGL